MCLKVQNDKKQISHKRAHIHVYGLTVSLQLKKNIYYWYLFNLIENQLNVKVERKIVGR